MSAPKMRSPAYAARNLVLAARYLELAAIGCDGCDETLGAVRQMNREVVALVQAIGPVTPAPQVQP